MTEAFILRVGDQEVWKAIVDGKVIAADFNCKGAALAAIPVERKRRKERQEHMDALREAREGGR